MPFFRWDDGRFIVCSEIGFRPFWSEQKTSRCSGVVVDVEESNWFPKEKQHVLQALETDEGAWDGHNSKETVAAITTTTTPTYVSNLLERSFFN